MKEWMFKLIYNIVYLLSSRVGIQKLLHSPQDYEYKGLCIIGGKTIKFISVEYIEKYHQDFLVRTTYMMDMYELSDSKGNKIKVLIHHDYPKLLLSNPDRVCGICTQLGISTYALRMDFF